jgi:hypothetical protein
MALPFNKDAGYNLWEWDIFLDWSIINLFDRDFGNKKMESKAFIIHVFYTFHFF